ncbi:MAG: sugar phosphate nucleotidyltransferase, partial [Desulfurococcaceae archaeon]
MKALILAAGRGERLQPITDTRPKPLIPILCKPLIEWIIRTIENTRLVDEVIIVVSYLKEKIINHINSLNVDLKIKFVDQGSELGTGDAVIKGLSNIKDIDEDVLIIYSDIFLSDWSVLRDIAVIDDNVIVGY